MYSWFFFILQYYYDDPLNVIHIMSIFIVYFIVMCGYGDYCCKPNCLWGILKPLQSNSNLIMLKRSRHRLSFSTEEEKARSHWFIWRNSSLPTTPHLMKILQKVLSESENSECGNSGKVWQEGANHPYSSTGAISGANSEGAKLMWTGRKSYFWHKTEVIAVGCLLTLSQMFLKMS